jgi:hypothetical protein
MNKLFKLPLTKTNTLLILLVSLSLLLINSCKKELLDSQNKNSIAWAKEYYNATLAISKPNAVSSDANSQPGATTTESIRTPLWELSSNGENEDFTFVEVPLNYNHRIASVIKISGENLTNAEKIEIANASFDVLMIYKNKQGVISQQVVTLIPDKNYLKKHNGDMSGNALAKLDSDFSGFLRYKDWNGEKMFLERIENGLLVKTFGLGQKIIKRTAKIIRSTQGKVMNPPMGGDNCETIEGGNYWIEDCDGIYDGDENCHTIYIGDYLELYCIGGGGNAEDLTPQKEIIDSVQNTCIKTQLNVALNAKTTILTMLKNTFSGTVQFEDLSLTFKDVTTLPDTVSGDASRASATSIYFDIRLNKNKLPTYSQEYILSTIYHEILHAFLYSKLTKGPDGKYNISSQHDDMANNYLILMTGALKIAFPNISDQEAWALSWGGLEQTNFYTTKLTEDQRYAIGQINRRYTNKLATDKKGTYCNEN